MLTVSRIPLYLLVVLAIALAAGVGVLYTTLMAQENIVVPSSDGLPDGFRYARWQQTVTLDIVEGRERIIPQAAAGYRLPLHGELRINFDAKQNQVPTASISDPQTFDSWAQSTTEVTLEASSSDESVLEPKSYESWDGTPIDGGEYQGSATFTGRSANRTGRMFFTAQSVGTVTLTFTPQSGTGAPWAGTSVSFKVAVYEPTVNPDQVVIPEAVEINEGSDYELNITSVIQPRLPVDVRIVPVSSSPTIVLHTHDSVQGHESEYNDTVQLAVEENGEWPAITISTLIDDDSHDTTAEYQFFFASKDGLANGKYPRTMRVTVRDRFSTPPTPTNTPLPDDTPTPTPTATPEPQPSVEEELDCADIGLEDDLNACIAYRSYEILVEIRDGGEQGQ